MVNYISRFGENRRAGAVCYLLPLALSMIFVPAAKILLTVGLVLLLIIAVLAPKASQLKFHAIQAMLLSTASLIGLGILYLVTISGGIPDSGFVGALITLGVLMVLYAGILLAFLLLSGILFFKTWRGKTARVPLLSEWAKAVSEGDYTVVKWIVVLLGIAVSIGLSNHYQEKEKLEQPVITENLLSEFDRYLAAFPLGATKEEVFSKAHEIDGKTELKYSPMYGTDYKKTKFSGYEAGLLFVISHRNDGPGSLREMKITMLSGNAPVEEIYRQLHQAFSERYGTSLQEGYPPGRYPGANARENGEGAVWEITPARGNVLMLMISLEPEKQKDDRFREFYIECRIKDTK